MVVRLTIVPRDDSSDDSEGLVVDLGSFVTKSQVSASLLGPQRRLTVVDNPFQFAACSQNFTQSSIDH